MLAEELDAGTVFMNRCDFLDPQLAWAGRKDSGRGQSLSSYGFHSYQKLKSVRRPAHARRVRRFRSRLDCMLLILNAGVQYHFRL